MNRLQKERRYQFRERMRKIHKENIRDFSLVPNEDELVLGNRIFISLPKSCGEVIRTAAMDFCDFLRVSMGITAFVSEEERDADIALELSDDLGEFACYKGYRINADDKITITGFDERGVMQALYNLEDIFGRRRAPYIKKDTYMRKPMYAPMMVHSGFGLDDYPDEHLLRIAHEGRDTILIFVKDLHTISKSFLDFNNLIDRARKYGIDVYAYSKLISSMHPDDAGAESYYDSTYGRLFRECPGLKGVSLVGESVRFPSKDPHVSLNASASSNEGIPTGKINPGWYPCCDYPQWLSLIKKVINKYNADADIIFWTYNWGHRSEGERVKLIENLPEGISLQATFEMYDFFKRDGMALYNADYTVSAVGPSGYFRSEAQAAKKRNIRLYSMTNTGGLTWDFGTVPYLPFPYQWIKRYKEMDKARDKWGLCGIMESHHYGFYPSFISKLSKWSFSYPQIEHELVLKDVLISEFGEENYEKIDACLKLWSEAITYFTPTDADQYGAFRAGPSYPLCLDTKMQLQTQPYAAFGGEICWCHYETFTNPLDVSYVGLRIPIEVRLLEKMSSLFDKGLDILRETKNENTELLYLKNMGEFMSRYIKTGLNAKRWFMLKTELLASHDKSLSLEIIGKMEKLIKKERENAESAIEFAEKDSRLGWEPSMEYIGDAEKIRWKLRSIDYVINNELKWHRDAIENFDKKEWEQC